MSEPLSPADAVREEYRARIHRVMDYIEAHLAEPLPLEKLARVANFSPFHFHRIFRGMTGETLNAFVARLRVERAAQKLIANPRDSVTQIAFDCGFSGSAPFARAFRATTGMSATEWRRRKIGQSNSKIDQSIRKPRKDFTIHVEYIATGFGHKPTWRIAMSKEITAEVEVKEMPEMCVAYIRHTGPFKGDAKLFEGLFARLCQWAGPRGLLQFPKTQMLATYHDDPNITEEDKLRLSVCVTVPPETVVDGEIGKMTIAGGKYAVARFELLPPEFEDAWTGLMGGWFPQSGYQPGDGLCYELYHNDPKQHPEGRCVVDLCVPVKAL
ncbi:AraC family transcriptional regulator [bacterium]|nr:AraC family transcriptional regulator [bacterium]